MLKVEHLAKSYGSNAAAVVAVADVSLSVERGQVIGLLGPNGAGKSTTVAMICGLVAPDSGRVLIDGEAIVSDDSPLKRRIGLVPQDIALFEDLGARGNLELFGALYGIQGALLKQRVDAALDLVGLADRARDKPSTYSGGMKRRLNIAAALVHDPDRLILDEPTVGVDPQSRNAIFDNLETLAARGKAIVYTTHYMEEAERLADRIVIIDHGRVVASDTPAELIRALGDTGVITIEVSGNVDVDALRVEEGVTRAEQTDEVLTLAVADLGAHLPRLLAWVTARGHAIRRISSSRATLEDVFLSLTGRQLRD
ncbi:MAG: ATP-binding cassette domain-containing protein [Burkholderiaceae bacterium]